MRLLISALVLAIVSVLHACDGDPMIPRTQVMAIVDAEPALRADIRRLRVRVRGRAAEESNWSAPSLDQEYSQPEWPFQVAIVPDRGDARRRLLFEAIAIDDRGDELIVVRAITGFLPERTLALPLLFERLCIRRPCEVESTCSGGVCASAEIDPRVLVDLGKYTSHWPDASVSETGELDASTDPPTHDAAAFTPDASLQDVDAGGDESSASDAGGVDASRPPSLCGTPDADATPGQDCSDVVACGSAGECDLTQRTCCMDNIFSQDLCVVDDSCGDWLPADCDGPEDCSQEASICCFEGGSAHCRSECQPGFWLCHRNTDCAIGKCLPGQSVTGWYNFWGFCR